jgi:hypothetical protein
MTGVPPAMTRCGCDNDWGQHDDVQEKELEPEIPQRTHRVRQSKATKVDLHLFLARTTEHVVEKGKETQERSDNIPSIRKRPEST